MLSSPEIKCLEDAGFPDNLCFKKPAGAFFAIRNGCAMMNKLYSVGHPQNSYLEYIYADDQMEFKNKRYYEELELIYLDTKSMDKMFFAMTAGQLFWSGEKKPTEGEIRDYIKKQKDELSEEIKNKSRPDFLKYTRLDYLLLGYRFLRNDDLVIVGRMPLLYAVYQSGAEYRQNSYWAGLWVFGDKDDNGNFQITDFPVSIKHGMLDNIPKEFTLLQTKVIITGDCIRYGKAVVYDSLNIPSDIFEKYGECFIYVLAKVEPKDTSWCGPLNSGT